MHVYIPTTHTQPSDKLNLRYGNGKKDMWVCVCVNVLTKKVKYPDAQ